METTLRFFDPLCRNATAEASRMGMTVTEYIEDDLRSRIQPAEGVEFEMQLRDGLMEVLLQATAHFRVGERVTRAEMHE